MVLLIRNRLLILQWQYFSHPSPIPANANIEFQIKFPLTTNGVIGQNYPILTLVNTAAEITAFNVAAGNCYIKSSSPYTVYSAATGYVFMVDFIL